MASLTEHQSKDFTKMILIGDSGTGKTGALASLVAAGYKLFILDYDNGLDSLVHFVKKTCPEKIGNVQFESLQDKFKSSNVGWVPDGPPTAFTNGLKLLNNWPGIGSVDTLGPDSILVIDSLTHMSNAAFRWAEVFKFSKDPRAIYREAQQAIETTIAALTAKDNKINFIMICHAQYIARGGDGVLRGFPKAVGSAISPDIPTYFNTIVISETVGNGPSVRRQIGTVPSAMIDTKNPAALTKTYPLETGLADLFHDLRG